MRLLNTASITLKEFLEDGVPPYAILSHTWEIEEVLLVDILNGTASSKKGYAKIISCCRKAAKDGFQWVWIDTCCIDKTSSAELSEAINSMYRYYALSTICYAYLQDVTIKKASQTKPNGTRKPATLTIADFTKSRWFTRGWTLQELLAPRVVEFHSMEWKEIGTKACLAGSLSTATGIPVPVMRGESVFSCNVAVRMSWASARQTTRVEDMAYCLLGLCNVNMPLLYGEGQKSFVRLQEQILKQQEDYSLFTWTLQHDCGESLNGILASAPNEFSNLVPAHLQPPTLVGRMAIYDTAADAGLPPEKFLDPQTFTSQFGISGPQYRILQNKDYNSIRAYDIQKIKPKYLPRQAPILTSRGLLLTLPVMPSNDPDMPTLAWVYCELDKRLICIALQPHSKFSRLHGRLAAPWLVAVDKSALRNFSIEEFWMHPNGLIQEGLTAREMFNLNPISTSALGRLRIVTKDNASYTLCVNSAFPRENWTLDEFFFEGSPFVIGLVGMVCYDKEGRDDYFTITCGIQNDHPWCMVDVDDETKTSEENSNKLTHKIFPSGLDGELGDLYSDRAVCLSRDLTNAVFTAAIRRTPTSQENTHTYILEVGSDVIGKCEPWVDLILLQMEKDNDARGLDLDDHDKS